MTLLRVTHIEDSPEALQFWAIDDKASIESSHIDKLLKQLEAALNGQPPPHFAICSREVVCVFDGYNTGQWKRAHIIDANNNHGTVKTFFIDTGETTWLPLAYLRYMQDLIEDIHVLKITRPLAKKYILADVAPPRSPSTTPMWTDIALKYLKTEVEGRVWKAETVNPVPSVRLFHYYTNEALANTLIERGFAFPSQSYQKSAEAKGTSPSHANSIVSVSPVSPADAFLPSMTTLPAVFRTPNLPFRTPEELVEASLAHQELSFLRNNFPTNERLVVKVVSVPQGPYGFVVHLQREEEHLARLQAILQTHHFPAYELIPKIGASCIVRSCDGLNYRGSLNSVRDSNRYLVELVDYGRSELCDFTQLHRITSELASIPVFGYRISLQDAEKMIQTKGIDQFFQVIVSNARTLTATAVQGIPNRVVLLTNDGNNVRETLIQASGLPITGIPMRTPSPLPTRQALSLHPVNIPDDVAEEEVVTVTRVSGPGYFFGILKKRCKDRLQELHFELLTCYEQEPHPPLLYADVRSHTGHFGVVKLTKEQKYFRARVQQEMVNEVQVLLIDDGRRLNVPRRDVLAPLPTLSLFGLPPYGIECRVDNVSLSEAHWSALLLNKEVRVKLEGQENGIYKISFTEDLCNAEVMNALLEKAVRTEIVTNEAPSISDISTQPPQVEIPQLQDADKEEGFEGSNAINNDRTPSPTEERPNSLGENRKPRNGSVRGGYSCYQHPNARNGNSKADTDKNWRSGNGQSQQVVRLPYGPPSKGAVGFQNKSASPPSDSPAQKEPSSPTDAPAKLSTPQEQAAYPAQVVPQQVKNVMITHVEDVDSFFVQLLDVSSDLEDLGNELNAYCTDPSATLKSIEHPTLGQPCVAKFADDGVWYRGRITQVNETDVQVLFVDYGNSQVTPICDIKEAEMKFLIVQPQAYQCRLAGFIPQLKPAEKTKRVLENYLNAPLQANFLAKGDDGKLPVRLRWTDDTGCFVINDIDSSVALAKLLKTSYHHEQVQTTLKDYTITKFYSAHRFYLKNVEASRFKDEETLLEEYYSSLFEDELLETEPAIDLPCVVKSLDDGKFYRAQVRGINMNVATVLFVDFGREQETQLKSLKRMLPNFMKWPSLARECTLGGVEVNCNQEKAIADCFPEGETVKARLKLTAADGRYEAEVTRPSYGNIAQYLLENKLAKVPVPPVEFATCLPAQDLDGIAAQINFNNITVTDAPCMSEFWIQTDSGVVDSLMEEIGGFIQKPEFLIENSFQPEIGKACLACFPDDNNWYRAVVTEVSGEKVSVHYVDYGNSANVSSALLRGLPSNLAQQPPQAVKCSVKGAEEATEADQWKFGNFIYNGPNVEVLERVGDTLYVRLFLPGGEVLLSQPVEEPVTQPAASLEAHLPEAAVQEQTTETITPEMSTGVESVPEMPPLVPIYQEPLPIDSALPKSNLQAPFDTVPDASEIEIKEEPAAPSEPQNNFAPANEQEETVGAETCKSLQGKELDVFITHHVSPSDFWIQSSDSATQGKLNEISRTLNSSYATESNQYAVQGSVIVDQVYGVRHPEYGEWFRAKVAGVNEADVQVHFIDYGDSSTVTTNDVLKLPETMRETPGFAIHCTVELPEGYDGWSLKAIGIFDKCLESICRVKLGAFENDAYEVMNLHCEGADVVEEVRNALAEGVAEILSETTASTYPDYQNELTPVTKCTEVESERLLTLDENEVIPAVSSAAAPTEAPPASNLPSRDSNQLAANEDLSNTMQSIRLSHSQLKEIDCDVTMLSLGPDPNISQTIDNLIIDARTQGGEADVKKEPDALESAVSPVGVELPSDLPRQPVMSCDLNQEAAELIVTADSKSGAAQLSIVHHEDPVEKPNAINVESIGQQPEDVAKFIPSKEPTEVAEGPTLVSQEKIDAVEEVPALEDTEEKNDGMSPPESCQATDQHVTGAVSEPIASCIVASETETIFNKEEPEKIYVSFIRSTEKFWIQYARDETDILNLESELTSLYTEESQDLKLTAIPVVGELYAVYSPQFENWFRGRATNVNGDKATVFYIDYGDSETVQFENIRELHESLRNIPPFAHECEWMSSAEDFEVWSDDAKEAFSGICSGGIVDAVFKSKSDVLEVKSLFINGNSVADLISINIGGEPLDKIKQKIQQGGGSGQDVLAESPIEDSASGAFIESGTPLLSAA